MWKWGDALAALWTLRLLKTDGFEPPKALCIGNVSSQLLNPAPFLTRLKRSPSCIEEGERKELRIIFLPEHKINIVHWSTTNRTVCSFVFLSLLTSQLSHRMQLCYARFCVFNLFLSDSKLNRSATFHHLPPCAWCWGRWLCGTMFLRCRCCRHDEVDCHPTFPLRVRLSPQPCRLWCILIRLCSCHYGRHRALITDDSRVSALWVSRFSCTTSVKRAPRRGPELAAHRRGFSEAAVLNWSD